MLLSITLAAAPAIVSLVDCPGTAGDPPSTRVRLEQRVFRRAPRDETSRVVRLRTEDKLSLAADYYRPSSKGSRRAPGAILVHDAGADRSQVRALATSLHKRGFGVLVLDLRGHGQSKGDVDWNRLDAKGRDITWFFAGRDLEAAADFLREQPEIHSARLTVVGVGAGCDLALRHAVDDEDVLAVVLINPIPNVLHLDLTHGVCGLEGLPCLILAPKDGRESAVGLQDAGHDANDGYEYVQISIMRSSSEEMLEDKRLNKTSGDWLKSQVKDDRDKSSR